MLDNDGTHKTPSVHRCLLRHPRFPLHFTPTYSSWINQAERWFWLLAQGQIRRGPYHSVRTLEDALRVYLKANDDHHKPFTWVKTAHQILASIARLCLATPEARHWPLPENLWLPRFARHPFLPSTRYWPTLLGLTVRSLDT